MSDRARRCSTWQATQRLRSPQERPRQLRKSKGLLCSALLCAALLCSAKHTIETQNIAALAVPTQPHSVVAETISLALTGRCVQVQVGCCSELGACSTGSASGREQKRGGGAGPWAE